MNNIKPGFYCEGISKEELIPIVVNGKSQKTGHYICHTCKTAMKRGRIPAMSLLNGLDLAEILEGCHLTELENNMIALNINFQYIFCLKKSRWAATKKQMISVPVTPETVRNTVQLLPRLPKDAGFVEVGLKRKKEYDHCHKKEYVNPNKILKTLEHMKKSGNKYYQFPIDMNEFEQRCLEQDKIGHLLIFDQKKLQVLDNEVDHAQLCENEEQQVMEINDKADDEDIDEDEIDDEDIDEEEIKYLTKDPIRKHQFDHNRNTTMTNNYPEMFVDKNGNRVEGNAVISFAPAEGNYPANILDEEDWDVRSWPALHPDGRYGIHQERRRKLSDQQYFGQRILNKDLRFSKSPGYIFAAAAYIEKKQLTSKANISFMRGKKTVNKEGKPEYDLDDAFTTFEGIKNTPKYWQKVKYDMIAKLENIGPFHLFFTVVEIQDVMKTSHLSSMKMVTL